MARWTNERAFDLEIATAAGITSVEPALIQAIIGAESAYRPDSIRPEPQIQDASRGLMQILYRTARAVGFTGEPEALLDPATNILWGSRYLAVQLSKTDRDIPSTISAYNGGYRPHLGFGRILTQPIRLCLARDTTTGDCINWHTAPAGEFGNQAYVDKVLNYYRYFKGESAPTKEAPPFIPGSLGEGGPGTVSIIAGFAILGGLGWLVSR